MVLLLLRRVAVYFAIGDQPTRSSSAQPSIPIAATGWLLESRAERTLERLAEFNAPTALVSATVAGHGSREQIVVGDVFGCRRVTSCAADATN